MKSKVLLLLLLANFSFYAQTNLVPNGDFETWSVSSKPDNWFQYFSGYISKSTVAQNGSSSINMMVASGTFNFINTEYFPVTAGKTYIVTMYHKLAKGTFSSVDFSLQHKPGTFKEIIIQKSDVVFSSTEWRKIEFEYTPTVSENVEVDIWTTGSLNSEILVDNVSVIDKYTSIPDINFENKLIDLNIDSGTADGKVLTSSISSVTRLDVSRSSISDLTGIENFTSLQTLIASRNSLSSVNLSKNTKLTFLNIGNNQLTALDLSTNTALENLDCQKNKLLALDIYNNINLTGLNCSSNALTSLNVTANTLLTELATNSNKITSLNIDNNVALQSINCGGNLLTALDVDKNLALKSLWCGSNKLTSLNIDKNLELSDLNCGINELTSLNVSNNKKLISLVCHQNKIKSLDVSQNILLEQLMCHYNELTSIDVWHNPELYMLNCHFNKITDLDISKNPKITEISCNDNNLTYLNLKNGNNNNFELFYTTFINNPNLTCIQVDNVIYANTNWSDKKDAGATFSTSCERFTFIPDINFENKLIALGFDSGSPDGKVLTSNIDTITTIDLYYSNISDLTGIEDFKSLKSLSCMSNKISTVDLSKNIALTYLNIGYNNLTTIDLSNNSNLENLGIYYNNLTSLDVSKNANLIYLSCQSNQITSFDLSHNTSLVSLWCSSNKLSSLDLSKNVALISLICSDNKLLTNINLKNGSNTKFPPSSSSIDFSKNPALSCIIVDNALHANQNWSAFKDVTASYSTVDCSLVTAIPDPAFENKLINLGIDTDGKNGTVLNSSISGITTLDVSSSSIKDLTGINSFTALNTLNCSGNSIVALNFAKNTSLALLNCSNNSLEKLNLKNGNNLNFDLNSNFKSNTSLSCIEVDNVIYSNTNWVSLKDASASYNEDCTQYTLIPDSNFENALIALEIDIDGKNGKVKTESIVKVTSLNLENLNISDLGGIEDFKALMYLNCNNNNITNIDVKHNKALRVLNLHGNQLSSLDVTENKDMFNLMFSKNKITTIDLSQNKNLHYLVADQNLLTSIDFSANPELESIYCGNNNLTTLNVSNLPNLNQLNCIYTNISVIDVRSNPKLVWLYLNDNKIKEIDLSQNPLLKYLNLGRNQLTTLDLSHNPLLELIFVENNPLTTLNVQNGNNKNFILPSQTGKKAETTDTTSFLKNSNLSCIQVDDVAYSNANWASIKDATATYSSTCKTLSIEDSVFSKVAMFPNPTKGEMNIHNIALDKATVYNSLGQLVKSFTLNNANTNNTIDLSGLPRGVYYVYIINGDAASAKKVIIE